MDEKILEITEEDLEQMSIEEVVDLKVEIEDLIIKLDSIKEEAERILNS